MIEIETDKLSKNSIEQRNEIVQKYGAVVKSLQENLKECKNEQTQIRKEVNGVMSENKKAVNVARELFHRASDDKIYENGENREFIENLQKQIAIVQLEKDSMFQLWQMALKAIDVLEQELTGTHKDEKTKQYYEDQVNNVKETYSKAIKELEIKLLQVKENYDKQQTLWHSTREKINELTRDKTELEKQLINIQNDMLSKEEINGKMIENLRIDLKVTKQEFDVLNASKIKLENEMTEKQNVLTRIIAKDQESKQKVAEAIDLVEIAVREKEIVLQREAMITDEKQKLEARLTQLSDEFVLRLDKELVESKKTSDKSMKKYIAEIKELETELREKSAKLEHLQCEYHLVEAELEKMRHGSQNYLMQSNAKVLEFEQKFKESQAKLQTCEESLRRKFDEKIREADSRITLLEEKLANANDRIRRMHLNDTKEMNERMRESDDRVKEVADRHSILEKRLMRALDERESVSGELRSLQLIHDREISRRENERRLLENRIRELQENIQRADDIAGKLATKVQISEQHVRSLEKELEDYKRQPIIEKIYSKNSGVEELMEPKLMQVKYEQKISELTSCIDIQKKLSVKWKDEAELMASKFHERYKELRLKMNILKKENEVLNGELISWRQQVALYRTESFQRYNQGENSR